MKVVTTNLLNRFWKNGIKPIMEGVAKKIDTSKIVKSTNITEDGFLMDGKTASEAITELNGKLPQLIVVSLTTSANNNINPFSAYAQKNTSDIVPSAKNILALSIIETPNNTCNGVVGCVGGVIYLHANKTGTYKVAVLVG